MDKPEITILFGAGAEGLGQFGLPSGNKFKKDIILAKGVAKFAELFLKDSKLNIIIKERTIIAHNSSSVLYQTIAENKEHNPNISDELFPPEKDENHSKESEFVDTYLDYKKNPANYKGQNIGDKFMKIYKEKIYNPLVNMNFDESNKSLNKFLEYAGIYSFLDSLFNYLRKPDLYKNECAKVIKVYYAALISILNGLVERLGENIPNELKESYSSLIQGDQNIADPYFELSKVIEGLQDAIVEQSKKVDVDNNGEQDKLYYYNIKQLVESGKKVFCITTNYTEIAQKIIGLTNDEIAYLHGKLNYFEELTTKRIDKIENVDPKKTIFPYLLVQSGVKPIISPKQIEEFYKACRAVEESEELLIIGYGINPDDEHIANILRRRLENNKKIKYFIHCDNKGDDKWKEEKNRINKQLESTDGIDYYQTTEFKDILDLFVRP